MKSYEDLREEAYTNVKEDRERLIRILNDATQSASDPEGKISLARMTVTVSECLTKANAQLIELVKIEKKGDKGGDDKDGFSEEDADSMFDEIADDKEKASGEN